MKEELEKGNMDEAKAIANEIKMNWKKLIIMANGPMAL